MNVSGSDVRLRYAGIILFLSRIFSTFTGAIFVLLVTRKLPVEQYGLWRMLSTYMTYTFVFSDVYNYWLQRTIARGVNTSKTGLTLSLMLGSVATLFYVILAFWSSSSFLQPLFVFLIAAPQVILYYIQFALDSVSIGYAPQINGYSRIVFELFKTALAFFLVFFSRTELLGAILAVMGAQIISVLFSTVLNFKIITNSKLDLNVARSWLKNSWLPIFASSVGMVGGLDVLLMRLLSGSEQPIAYYGIALAVAGTVTGTNVIAVGLYPRLLAKASKSEAEVIIRLMYMFAIPISIFTLFYAEPVSAIYGLKYLAAIDTIRIVAVASLFFIFSSLLDTIILGVERKDVEGLSFKDVSGSMLFKLPLLNLLFTIIHLALVYAFQIDVQDYAEASFRWIVSTIVSNSLSIVVKLTILERVFKMKISANTMISILRYFAVSLLVTFLSTNMWKVIPTERILDLFLSLLPSVIFTATAYFMFLAILDKDCRYLLYESFNRIRKSLKSVWLTKS